MGGADAAGAAAVGEAKDKFPACTDSSSSDSLPWSEGLGGGGAGRPGHISASIFPSVELGRKIPPGTGGGEPGCSTGTGGGGTGRDSGGGGAGAVRSEIVSQ